MAFWGAETSEYFVLPDEIAYYCSKNKIRMCLDVSHSMLTCNHLELDFYEFVSKVAPFTSHLHLGDAIGVNGEGLQIDEGEIDFVRLSEILKRNAHRLVLFLKFGKVIKIMEKVLDCINKT